MCNIFETYCLFNAPNSYHLEYARLQRAKGPGGLGFERARRLKQRLVQHHLLGITT